jgi:hypothetical protein
VYANTFKEFRTRLLAVFERLKRHNLTVNPTKCVIGLSQVEFVGHVIDENGLSHSQVRREEVFNIPLPMIGVLELTEG